LLEQGQDRAFLAAHPKLADGVKPGALFRESGGCVKFKLRFG
jgi:hypothetical protein